MKTLFFWFTIGIFLTLIASSSQAQQLLLMGVGGSPASGGSVSQFLLESGGTDCLLLESGGADCLLLE